MKKHDPHEAKDAMHPKKQALRFLCFSAVGIFVFFVPIPIAGKSTIVLDHIVTALRNGLPRLSVVYALLVVAAGGLYPFVKGDWKSDRVATVFALLKAAGVLVSVLYALKTGPALLFEKDLLPFLFEKLVIPVGIIVPVGAIFLAFLVDYGLLEFIGVLMQPVMRPLWKTPGRSAVDAVASFVGSYSIGLLITNRVFREGKYTVKEAAIIATGFSTVSATFMVIVAKTTGLMGMWNLYFWSTLVITFAVTAVTVRIPPLRSKSEAYVTASPRREPELRGKRLSSAWRSGLAAAANAPSLRESIGDNLRDGFLMAMSILPSIMSVGLLGLLLAKYTPVFDLLGYFFWPVTRMFHLPEAMLAAKATALEISEMFLPALLVTKASLATRYVIAVVSVSSVLFFSASIPCILSTDIPISIPEILLIWVERAVLSLLLAGVVAQLFS